MRSETLTVVWKLIRRKGYGRTPETYCTYVVKNEKHEHRLRTSGDSTLFQLLESTVIRHKFANDSKYLTKIYVDGVYDDKGKLLFVKNPRKL